MARYSTREKKKKKNSRETCMRIYILIVSSLQWNEDGGRRVKYNRVSN